GGKDAAGARIQGADLAIELLAAADQRMQVFGAGEAVEDACEESEHAEALDGVEAADRGEGERGADGDGEGAWRMPGHGGEQEQAGDREDDLGDDAERDVAEDGGDGERERRAAVRGGEACADDVPTDGCGGEQSVAAFADPSHPEQ